MNAKALEGAAAAGIPKGVDKEEVLNAAARYALKDDTSCVRGPPKLNPALPGLRYGASLELRPQLLILPCPCAGGVRTPAVSTDEGALESNGLWATAWVPPVAGGSTGAVAQPGAPSSEAGAPAEPEPEAATSFMFKAIGRALKGRLGGTPPYYAGSEPYSADYGCARGYRGGGLSRPLEPGKRWWDTPRWAPLVIATPCPCALSTWAGLQGPSGGDSPIGSLQGTPADDSLAPLPQWQEEASPLLASASPVMASLAAGAPAPLSRRTRKARSARHSWSAAFL